MYVNKVNKDKVIEEAKITEIVLLIQICKQKHKWQAIMRHSLDWIAYYYVMTFLYYSYFM